MHRSWRNSRIRWLLFDVFCWGVPGVRHDWEHYIDGLGPSRRCHRCNRQTFSGKIMPEEVGTPDQAPPPPPPALPGLGLPETRGGLGWWTR